MAPKNEAAPNFALASLLRVDEDLRVGVVYGWKKQKHKINIFYLKLRFLSNISSVSLNIKNKINYYCLLFKNKYYLKVIS